jgi:cystathionine gamma-synthase
MEPALHPSTIAVSSGRPPHASGSPINQPIVPASTFHAEGEIEYAREDNPSAEALERALADLEGGSATVFSSGMAAANAILDLIPLGSTVLAPTNTYTGIAIRLAELAERGAIRLRYIDVTRTEKIISLLTDADVLWLESPTNPLLDVADLRTCLASAKAANVMTVVDNTFATPVAQQPLSMGADYVLHSVTKMISGHSDLLLGAVITSNDTTAADIRERRLLLGAMPSSFDCFLALRGLRTLFLRYEKSESNAREIVAKLQQDQRVSKVRYPGSGSIIAIEVKGNADSVCRATKLWTYATSLGGVESLLERRRRWQFESNSVPESLIRLSLGIEHPEDLWKDLDQALNHA